MCVQIRNISIIESCYAGCAQRSVLPALKSFVVARIRLFQPFQSRNDRTHAHRCVTSIIEQSVILDPDGNVMRHIVRPAGLIDIKVCSIDDFWSAAKFVWRKGSR